MFSDTLETNDSLREELDDIVGGLQTYLAQVQTKAAKKEREFDQVLAQCENLQVRHWRVLRYVFYFIAILIFVKNLSIVFTYGV